MMNKQIDSSKFLPPLCSRHALLLLLAIAWTTAASASEVYTWTDQDGTVHYSDTPRGSGDQQTLEVGEIYRPGSGDAYPAASPDAAASSDVEPGEEAAAPLSAAEQRRQEIAADRAERKEAQAEADRLCALHRQRLEKMEPSRRVFYTDANGESVRMDDEQRVALVEESKAFLAENCGG